MRRLLAAAIVLWSATASATDVTIGGSTYTLAGHPRLLMDGPAGTITARVKDPDGAGAGVAPQATDANPAFVALKNQVRSCRAAPTYCSTASERVTTVWLLALDWYMDNSQTDSLTAALWNLNNIETWIGNRFQFGCDINSNYCGRSDYNDWPSADAATMAQVYSIVRSEMSAGERTAFAQKMFNDNTVYEGDNCTPQLQQIGGAVANYTTGTTAITGSGLSGVTAGRMIYLRAANPAGTLGGAGGWQTVSTVNNDSSITLNAALTYALGSAFPSISNAEVWELKPWTATTCGMVWNMQHDAYGSRTSSGYVSTTTTGAGYTSGSTSFTVASAVGFPTPPFYIQIANPAEVMKVTNVVGSTFTVERAKFGTSAGSNTNPGGIVRYNRYLPQVGVDDPVQNLVLTKTLGLLFTAIALADDSARAAQYVQWAADDWLTNMYPKNRDMWTGFQQAGSSNYGPGRQLTMNYMIMAALKNIDSGLNKSGGSWLTYSPLAWLYTLLPGQTETFAPWGQAGIASSPAYHSHTWAPLQTYLLGAASDSAKYWNYWQRTTANLYTSANLTAGSNERLLPFALMYWQEADATATFTGLPTQRAFNLVDGDSTKALNHWVSRTGWTTATDTLIFDQAFNYSYTYDHIGRGSPGGYKVYKGGWLLTENDQTKTGQLEDGNMLLFGGAANQNIPSRVDMDRVSSGTGWAFARVNVQGTYASAAAVTRALRFLVHFKKAASPDYLVVYDSAATSAAKSIGFNLHYDKTAGQGSSISDTLPNIVWTGPDRRLSTKVVLPSGTGAARVASSLTNSFREYLCASTDGSTCASVTSAAFLLVHKPATSTSDTMPTVSALATIDSDFDGVEIQDSSAPSVAVFAKLTDQNGGSFTTTLTGTAQIIVSGLVAGTYDITKGGAAYLSSQSVDANGVLAFTGTAAAYAITQTGVATPPTITTTTLSNGVLGQAYSATLQASDGALPLVWDVSAGSLCTGITLSAGGVLSGTPTTVQTCSFTARVTDNLAQSDTQALSLTIQTPPPTLTVKAQPGSNSVVLKFGTPGLSSGQSCDVFVSAVSQTCNPPESAPCSIQVGSSSSSGGAATRLVSISSLSASTSHTATVTCGSVAAGSVSFSTLSGSTGGSYTLRLKPTAATLARMTALDGTLATAKAAVYWKAPGEGSYTATKAVCPSGCTITKSSLASGIHSYYIGWESNSTAIASSAARPASVAIP